MLIHHGGEWSKLHVVGAITSQDASYSANFVDLFSTRFVQRDVRAAGTGVPAARRKRVAFTTCDGYKNITDQTMTSLRRIVAIRPKTAPNRVTVDAPSGTLFTGLSPLKRVRLEKPPNPFDPVPLEGKVY